MTMKRNFDIEKIAQAIEADMGEALPDIRTALAEVKAGAPGRVTMPERINLHPANRARFNSEVALAGEDNSVVIQ